MHKHLLVLSAAALLTACGSGDDYSAPPMPPAPAPAPAPADPLQPGSQVPGSAAASASAATAFVRSSAASSSDSGEPLELGEAQLASSDNTEPEEP